ncbi:MAG: T9SS type A sorting domain-containing protein [Bacteroidetes bacterium]|nr:T9SS type A sorting domain-containing protein [Bacteroidota bacterium]
MKSTYSNLTKAFLLIAIVLMNQTSHGQTTGINYTISQPAGALQYNSISAGQVDLISAANTDDQLVSFPASAVAAWGGFFYGGVWYPQATTTFWVSSNGWVAIQNTANPSDVAPPSSLPVNDLGASPYRIIAPLWDDLKLHPVSGGRVTYKNSPAGAGRVLIIEWKGMYWDKTGTDSAISFQARIYNNISAAPNAIEFRYKRNGSATYGMPATLPFASASIGLSGFCNNDIFAWTNAAGTVISKTVPENQAIASKPADAGSYRFTPVVHPNDNCAGAFLMALNPGLPLISSIGTTLHSTQTAIAIPGCGGITTTSDVWYTFSKPANITNFEIFTDSVDCRGSANYGMGMEVYTACGGAPVACNYGATGPAGTNATSYLNMTAQTCALQSYWVRVFSKDTSYRGYFRFNIRPPGRDCAYATDISACCAGLPFNYSSPTLLSTCGFNNDVDSNAACGSLVERGQDYVFKFTPCATMCATFNLNNTTLGSNPGMFIYYNPPCGAGAACVGSVTSVGGGVLTFANASLAAGNTYYIVIDYDSGGFTPCLTGWDMTISGVAPPVLTYDNCATPQLFAATVGASCVGAVDFNNNCATPSAAGTVPLPGCGSFTDGVTPDVWFTFNSLSANPHQINVDLGTAPSAQDMAMAIYTGACGGLTLVSCDDNSNGTMPSLTITPPGAGTTYYVRLWSNNGTKPGNFRICAIQGCTPTNDLCTGAIALTVGAPIQGDNGCSTGTGEPSSGVAPACWTAGSLNTVWYSFVATNTQMRIRTRLLTMFDSQIALYSLPTGCGGAFTMLFCNDNAPASCGFATNRNSEITATGLTIGTTYYVRVDGTAANTGTFEIIVMDGNNPYPPIPQQDCVLPINVCNSASFTVANPGFQGTGNVCDFTAGSCLASGERGAAWYTFSVTGPQTLQFTITPNSPNDYDFMIWCVDTVWNGNPSHSFPTVANYCSNLMTGGLFPWYSCNYSAVGTTGLSLTCLGVAATIPSSQPFTQCGGFNQALAIPAGMTATFVLNVSNFTTSTTGFTMNWNGTVLNSNPPSMTWQNSSTTAWTTLPNWYPNNCGAVPDCANQVGAIIAGGAWPMPILTANQTLKDITINAGASLTINAGVTLNVCGNFTNNGTINCIAGSTVKFIGGLNQSINGTFLAALNNFANFTVAKSTGTLTFNTNIFVRGNFAINGPNGIVNVNSKNIEVGGNFYNYNGTTSFTGHGAGALASTLTFTRRSGANQLFQNDGTNLTLNNVAMNQIVPGGLVSLNANATSDMIIGPFGTLTLTQGVIVTGAGTAREVNVTNSAAAACTPGNATSWVFGLLRRSIATALNSYDFPVGTLTNYERANINYTAVPTGVYNLLAQFKVWGGTNCAFPGPGPAASECVTATYAALPYFDHGYWSIDASIGAPTGTYEATMYNVGMTNNAGAGWTVVKATSGTCAFGLPGGCWIPSTAVQTRRVGLSGFSDFATVQSQTPLPIELLSFEAIQVSGKVSCKWITSTEINNDHFDVERSTDATNYTVIGTVKGFGQGVTTINHYYEFKDGDFCSGKVYYRLKQVDMNGAFTYSNIVSVSCKNSLLNLAPNPTANNVVLTFYENTTGEVTIEVTDMVGQIALKKHFNVEAGYNEVEVGVSALPEGVYYLKVLNKDPQQADVAKQVKFLKY